MNIAYQTTADDYLRSVISQHQHSVQHRQSAINAGKGLYQYIRNWAGRYLLEGKFSGSFAKGTAISGTSDIDLFISLLNDGSVSHPQQYNDLHAYLKRQNLSPQIQNVSLHVEFNGISVDIVPAWKHSGNGGDHSLYTSRNRSWTKTNVDIHISKINQSGRIPEILLTKIWRKKNGLDFPSFYLELAVIESLSGQRGSLSDNFRTVLNFLKGSFEQYICIDPANTNNRISEDVTAEGKKRISRAAAIAVQKKNWGEIV